MEWLHLPLRVACLFVSCLFCASAFAGDGRIMINDKKIMAGGITPGDAPGYPATLSLPGSYVLSGNLQAPAGGTAIIADTVEITIDLNGYRIEGSNLAEYGIRGKQRHLTVRNGTVQHFKQTGIEIAGFGSIVDSVRLAENRMGIRASGDFVKIANSVLINNRDTGIECYRSCRVEGNYIANNADTGLISSGGTALGNTFEGNGRYGIFMAGPGTPLGLGNNTIMGSPSSIGRGDPLTGPGAVVSMGSNACIPACP